MTLRRFLSHAPAIKQARSYTFAGTWAQGETVTVTIDNIDLVVTIGAAPTPTTVATAVYQAYANVTMTSGSSVPAVTGSGTDGGGQAMPQFAELVATNPSAGVLTLTGSEAGVPVTVSIATNSAAGTVTPGTLTAASGPDHANNADNYRDNGVPAAADELVFDFGDGHYSYETALGVQLDTITQMSTFTGTVGLREQNRDDETPGRQYGEYRQVAPSTVHDGGVGITVCHLGVGDGQGCERFRWDFTNGRATINVYNKGASQDTGVPTYLFSGTHASNQLNNLNGDVGIAFYPDEPMTLGVLNHGSGDSSQASTYCGDQANLTACEITINGGTVTFNSALCTTSGAILVTQGTVIHQAGNVKDLTLQGGVWRQRCGGTISGTLYVMQDAEFDASQNSTDLTITNPVQLYPKSKFSDPNKTLPVGTQFKLNGCDLNELELKIGRDRTIEIVA